MSVLTKMHHHFFTLSTFALCLRLTDVVCRLWEAMRCKLVPEFLRYKMYRLHIVR